MTNVGGAMAALIAPRRESGYLIDIGLALDVLGFVMDAGMEGLAVLGATGEFVHYDFEDRQRLAQMAVRRSKVPIIVNVSHSTLEGAILMARAATALGAAALLLMPPYFFRYRQDDIAEFYLQFIAQAGKIAPVLLYNLPFFTTPLEPETACSLLATGRFEGIKDSSGDPAMFAALHAQRASTPFRLLIGNDGLLASHRAQADGVISGCACAVPELIRAIDHAAVGGDAAALERRAKLLADYLQELNHFPTPFGIQLTLAVRGFPKAAPPLPLGAVTRARAEEFRNWLPAFLTAMREECARPG